jgi:UDP-glucose 4-epimerase
MADAPVWITGAGGFIGAQLARRLVAAGQTVLTFGRPSGTTLRPLDAAGLEQALNQSGAPGVVYHLAGGSTVGHSFADPAADFDSNVASTIRLLDLLRRHAPAAHLVLASSAAVYGAGHAGPVGTSAALAPASPYGQHKRMAELAVEAQVAAFGLRASVLRLFSVYGPGLRKQLLHDICRRLAQGESPLELGGSGDELRDWVHVSDVCAAMASLSPPPAGQMAVYNLGTGRPTPVRTVAAGLIAALGLHVPLRFSGARRPGDPFCLLADPHSLPPNFVPAIALDVGLAQVAADALSKGAR